MVKNYDSLKKAVIEIKEKIKLFIEKYILAHSNLGIRSVKIEVSK